MSGARALPAPLAAALHMLRGPFVVADLKPPACPPPVARFLKSPRCAQADGVCEREYAQVVRTRGRVPPFISQLTGITQAEVDRFGIPVRQAFSSFLDFVEDLPVFFHNASFDRRFLAAA